ncbi:DoxX family protein [Fulvivirgaceae bacterium BMA12]|uniref:DoxX family protein n=1 Tax=Agaribacillus aureus TaxID=3051825 RepID=A0ABT8L222_9BACT|nr:DoxX family protein [Fulvivirgaceae bacterium BMA12]
MLTSSKKSREAMLLFLRLTVVFVFLWHGIPKAIFIGAAVQKFTGMGFPGFLGPVIGWVEVIAGSLILIGFQNKWANLLLAAVIIVAIAGVQLPKGVTAGLERDILLLAANLISAFFGPGLLSLDNYLAPNTLPVGPPEQQV